MHRKGKEVAKKVKKTAKKKAASKKPRAKKASTKKVSKKKVSTKKGTLAKTDIDYFKQLLLKKRLEIIGDVNYIEKEALKKSRLDAAGDLSSMPIHMADIGTDNFEQEFVLGLMDSERKMLVEINEALIRIDNGVYGICQGTSKPIAKARLEAKPWARYCIEYATMVEKGLIIEGEKIIDESTGARDREEEDDEDIKEQDLLEAADELDEEIYEELEKDSQEPKE